VRAVGDAMCLHGNYCFDWELVLIISQVM